MAQTYDYGDYNRGGMLAFSFSMAITLAFFIYVAFIHSGVDLQELPADEVKVESSAQGESDSAEGEAE